MKTIEYSVCMPEEIENTKQEIEKRLTGTDMTWTRDSERSYLVSVPVDSDDEEVVLEQSARKVFAVFQDILNPEIDELPYPRTAHKIIKYFDKQKRRPAGWMTGYLGDAGEGRMLVSFTVITHSTATGQVEAAADCEHQIAGIIDGENMTAALDIPAWPDKLKKSGTPVYFAVYRIAVRVPQQENSFRTTALAAEKLWSRVKDRQVYVELDDMNSTLLEAIIKYHIPKSHK